MVKVRINKFLNLAKKIASESIFKQHKLGACIIIKNEAIAYGYNSYKTHPMQKKYNKSSNRYSIEDTNHYIHAEMAALAKANSAKVDLQNAEIFIYRLSFDGNTGLSRPCVACMQAIKDHGIKVIHYTTDNGYITEYLDNSLINSQKQKNNK